MFIGGTVSWIRTICHTSMRRVGYDFGAFGTLKLWRVELMAVDAFEGLDQDIYHN